MIIRSEKRKETSRPAGAGRGRPRRTSRDAIIEAAAALLRENPESQLSLNATARALNVTPMAIYTYFESKDALQQAVTEHLFSDFTVTTPKNATPLEKIIAWAHATRRHFLDRPELIDLLVWEGGHVSIGWLERSAVIIDAVSEMGFDESEIGEVTLWVWQVIMGAINIELHSLRSRPMLMSREEFENLDDALKRRISLVRSFGERDSFNDDFFAYQIDRMSDALAVLVDKRNRSK